MVPLIMQFQAKIEPVCCKFLKPHPRFGFDSFIWGDRAILHPSSMEALTASITADLRRRNAREANLGGAVREVVRLRGELKVLHPIILWITLFSLSSLPTATLFPRLEGRRTPRRWERSRVLLFPIRVRFSRLAIVPVTLPPRLSSSVEYHCNIATIPWISSVGVPPASQLVSLGR